jgi:hypothetical protein
MEQQASEKLGEPVSMVATVSTKGTGKKTMLTAGIGGVVGAAAAAAVSNRGKSALGEYKGYLVLGLGEKNLGVFKQKTGLLKPSCGDLLESIPLEQIASFKVAGGALTVPLTIGMADGTELEFEVPRAHKGKAEKLGAAIKR